MTQGKDLEDLWGFWSLHGAFVMLFIIMEHFDYIENTQHWNEMLFLFVLEPLIELL